MRHSGIHWFMKSKQDDRWILFWNRFVDDSENIISIGNDKTGVPYYVTLRDFGETVLIELYRQCHQFGTDSLLILSVKFKDRAEICDIQNSVNSIGIGSALMKSAIRFAQSRKIKEFTGFLCVDDLDHRDRQISFYQKFGFSIIATPTGEPEIYLSIPAAGEL